MDLDHFKEINDTLGHHAGDRLLCDVGDRLGAILRESDTVARFGGDEFALLLPDVSDEAGAAFVAERIRDALALPLVLEGIAVEAESSVGIALFPEHGTDPDQLLQRADVAMYQAKEDHVGHCVYRPESDRHSPRRLALLSEVRSGLDRGDFRVLYHPIVDVGSGAVRSVEALIRWEHPVHGLVMPGEFIPLAERTGLIRPLTLYVLESALAQCARWRESGIRVGVSVNLSARNLLDTSFPDQVAGLLERHGIPGEQLQLEITENTLMSDPGRARLVLTRLRELGARLAIDDFGTGYSSLSYLKHLPVTELKIDRSFVMHMNEESGDRQIVRSTVALGKNLGLTVVAEGVETCSILDELEAVGCDQAQGFLFTKPLAADDFAGWWRERSGTTVEDAAGSPA
jgi:diguanylate cyclase (GGDEF)-like protein